MANYCSISEEVLEQLRERCDNMLYNCIGDDDCYQEVEQSESEATVEKSISNNGEARRSSDLISDDIKQLKKKYKRELYTLYVGDFGKKLRYARIMAGYSQEYVAEAMGLSSHSSISEEENDNTIHKIDPTRLEAYSLIYHILPSELLHLDQRIYEVTPEKSKEQVLDITNPADVLTPLTFIPDTFCMGCENVIMNTLYDPDDHLKIQALHVIAVIGILQKEAYQKLYDDLASAESFSELFDEWFDRYDYIQKNGEWNWMTPEAVPTRIDYSQRDSWEYTAHYVYFEAQTVLEYLVSRQLSSRLEFLARIAELEPAQMERLLEKLQLDQYLASNHCILDEFLHSLDKVANNRRDNEKDFCWGICQIPAGVQLFPNSLKPELDLTAHLLKS